MVMDENGTDYATTLKEFKLTNFSINSVVKAIEKKEKTHYKQFFFDKKTNQGIKN
jgi:hypothetical protein